MNIIMSEAESKVFNMRVGRLEVEDRLQPTKFNSQVEELNLDFVRLKAPIACESINSDLYETGYPFFFSGGIRRYEVDCFKVPLVPLDPDVDFELYTGEKKELLDLEWIMNDTWGKYPLGYYKTPVLRNYIDRETEMKALFKYYSLNNNNITHPSSFLWFLKFKGELAGFIALNTFPNDNFELSFIDSTIAGIYSKFQNKGLFPNVLRHVRAFCRINGYRFLRCGARLENLYSQKAFEKDDMTVTGIDMVYHIVNNKKLA